MKLSSESVILGQMNNPGIFKNIVLGTVGRGYPLQHFKDSCGQNCQTNLVLVQVLKVDEQI